VLQDNLRSNIGKGALSDSAIPIQSDMLARGLERSNDAFHLPLSAEEQFYGVDRLVGSEDIANAGGDDSPFTIETEQ
jgi:hypothetical protein